MQSVYVFEYLLNPSDFFREFVLILSIRIFVFTSSEALAITFVLTILVKRVTYLALPRDIVYTTNVRKLMSSFNK